MNQAFRRAAPLSLRLVLCIALGAWTAGSAVAAPKKKPKKEAAPAPTPAVTPALGDRDLSGPDRPYRAPRPKWEGFFVSFNLGYASAGGKDGPVIPDPTNNGEIGSFGSFEVWAKKGCLYPGLACYNKAVTTNKGSGMAAALQIGYNILGYASLWADLSWHGTFGSKVDMAGNGTAAAMLGFHPLRFVRQGQLPVDVKIYGGYGFFDILYYYENQFQTDAKGKAWTGTALPFGLQTEYRLSEHFAMGVDLRLVKASYDKWIYNNDKDIASNLSTPETTLRFEPRVTFAGHF